MSSTSSPGSNLAMGATFKRLLSLSFPIIGVNVLNVLALAVDTAMCGRLENANVALTALGFATQVVFLLMVAMLGLTVGTVALVARAYGAGDTDRVNHILQQSSQLTILLAIGVAILGNIGGGTILELLGASAEVRDVGMEYLRPLLTGAVFYYLSILYGAVLRGVGNTLLAFLVALGSNAINVFVNYGLILGNMGFPAMGLQGAAIGTVTAYAFGAIALIVLIRRGTIKDLFLPLKPKAIDRGLAWQLVKIGAPAALDMVILNASFLSIVGMLGRIEELAVAAHGIGLRIQALAFVPGMSISQATGALVGQALGAENAAQARRTVKASIVLCVIIMSALAIAIVFAAYPIVGIFDVASGSLLESLSVDWMRLLGYGMPIVGVYIAFVGMLQGSGKTQVSLFINVVATVAFQIPLSYLLGFTFEMGAVGVWLGLPLSFVLKAILGVIAYRVVKWDVVGARFGGPPKAPPTGHQGSKIQKQAP